MLINVKGVIVQPQLPHNQKQREAVLAALREVLEPENHKCGTMFKISTRARLRNA